MECKMLSFFTSYLERVCPHLDCSGDKIKWWDYCGGWYRFSITFYPLEFQPSWVFASLSWNLFGMLNCWSFWNLLGRLITGQVCFCDTYMHSRFYCGPCIAQILLSWSKNDFCLWMSDNAMCLKETGKRYMIGWPLHIYVQIMFHRKKQISNGTKKIFYLLWYRNC